MGHFGRLLLVARVTYYLGWIALLCGGLAHLNIATRLFLAMNLSQRNLLEIGITCFVICMASELRARDSVGADVSNVMKRQTAA